MKRVWIIGIVVLVVIGISVVLTQKRSVKNDIVMSQLPVSAPTLTAEEVNEAITYGKKHKDDLLIDFEKPWTVFLGYGEDEGSAVIFTPYHCLSLMARNSVQDNSAVDTETLYRLWSELYKEPYFEVTLYSMEDFFDREYKTVVLKDGEEMPVLKTFHQGYDQAREYTITSRQKVYFSPEVLQDKGKVTLRVVRPEKEPIDFVFDLEKIL